MNVFDDREIAQQSWSFEDIVGRPREWTPRRKPRVITASTSVNPLDDTHLVDCTSGAVTLTLETCVAGDGRKHTFKKTDSSSNAMIIDGLGSQTVEGAATVSTIIQGITFIVWSDGIGGWYSVILAPGTASAGGSLTSVNVAVAKDDTYLTSGGPITSSGTITETAVDAGSDKLVGWDDSADKKIYFTLGTGLSTSTTTLNASVTISKDDTETPSGTTITAVDAGSDKIVFWDDSADKKVYGTLAGSLFFDGTTIRNSVWIAYRLCHKDTALTTGEREIDYPPGFTFLDAYVSVDTVSSSGLPTFDIKESGTTMLSTLITVDVSENTSTTAATPPVISDSTFTAFNKLSIHCTVAGTGTKGAVMHMKVIWT